MSPKSKSLYDSSAEYVELLAIPYFPLVDLEVREASNLPRNKEQGIHRRFENQVQQTPDAIALRYKSYDLNYKELNARANQVAHYLRDKKVKSDILISVYMDRSPEMVIALLGVLKAGGAYVPLDPAYPSDRISFILEETQVPIILSQSHLQESLPTHNAEVLCLDSDQAILAQYSRENLTHPADDSDLMYVIYTSGSTGKPKGVMITHAGIQNQLNWRQETFPLTGRDRVLQNISFSFDPSVWQIFWTLCSGAELILPRLGGHQESAYLVELIATYQITVIAMVPSMLRVLLEEKNIDQCRCLRYVFCGGEALPADVQARFFERLNLHDVLYNVYGPTEASIDATFWSCQSSVEAAIAPIGRPISNTQIYLLDSELKPVPAGEVGELHIGGLGLARGYFNRPNLTEAKFIPSPFAECDRLYKTGDLVRYLPDGNVEFLGRIDHQVKVRGFRIELGEIEAVLNQHPAIQQSLAIAQENRLIAYCVAEQTVAIAELRSYLADKLPAYMVPAAFVMLDEFPLNPNGKIDRHALPAPERPELDHELTAPADEVEQALVEIWEKVLDIHPIGVTDHFVELGGDSLKATQIVQKIEQLYDHTLPLVAFFQAPTIQQVANILRNKEELISSIVPIQPNGSKPPLFGIHVLGKGLGYYRPMAKCLGEDYPVYGLSMRLIENETPDIDIAAIATQYIQNLRVIQPQGPYHLVGVSFGGVIAFEMAHQLMAAGEPVALLGMLDSNAPLENVTLAKRDQLSGYWKRLKQFTPDRILSKLKKGLAWRLLKVPGIEELSRKIYQLLDRPYPDGLQTMLYIQENQRASTRYIPQVYPGKLVLFKAKDQAVSVTLATDPRLEWAKLTEVFEVQEVPGDHIGILNEPHVQVLAEKIKLYFEPAERG
jgi:amino acid adenylation domain-containing protein